MRIQPNDMIVGQPVLAIRKLLKYVQRGPDGMLETIAQQLAVDISTAEQVYADLLREGYIEPSEPIGGYKLWHNTHKGNALANASARKPISRRTAERVVEEFLQRVREINANSEYAYRVKQVIAFGSFLSDSPTLGDVDLSIELEDRYQDTHEREIGHKARIAAARKAGREFRDYMEMLLWPEQEVLLLLKNRSPSLSLHGEWREQVLSRPIPSEILFDASSQIGAPSAPVTHEHKRVSSQG
jgi:DNA-binding transcriptional regulator YhcF (GntR family)